MKVVLISCVARKVSLKPGQRIAAKELYISPMFKLAWKYAVKLNPDRIYILSAKHGLVSPDTMIETYNQTLNNASVAYRKQWATDVLSALRNEGIDLNRDKIVILAGESYSQYLVPAIKHCSRPYQDNGCKGIGYILQFLKNETS